MSYYKVQVLAFFKIWEEGVSHGSFFLLKRELKKGGGGSAVIGIRVEIAVLFSIASIPIPPPFFGGLCKTVFLVHVCYYM